MVLSGSASGSGAAGDEVLDSTAGSLQEKLPVLFAMQDLEERFETRYEESMNTVLKQECLRYNKLLLIMESSLKDFRKATKGLVVMTRELENIGKSLFLNEVAEIWALKGPLSLKPLSSWFLDIIARCHFLKKWAHSGETPAAFWVSGFFFPQAFFTGALQNYARRYQLEID
eukprot:1375659-Amphidinium_carterae.1